MNKNVGKIRKLNDQARANGGVVAMGDLAFEDDILQTRVIEAMRAFDAFTEENDPYGEHDMGFFDIDGERFCFKIDYYDTRTEAHSLDPANELITKRIVTVMYARDY